MRYRHLSAILLAALATGAAQAQTGEPFYAGKVVKVVIGFDVGGEYGQYATLVARNIGRHIPGEPSVVVQPMPGAGGITSLNYLANVAPKDGTVLTIAPVNIVQDGLFNPQVKYDPASFQWIGRIATLVQVGVSAPRSKLRSISDAQAEQFVAGGAGATNPTALNFRILNEIAGTKFKIIAGYKGTAHAQLAWERGEIDVVTTSWDTVKRQYPAELQARSIAPIYVYSLRRVPELAGVPLLADLGRDEVEKAFLQVYSAGTEIGRSLAAPPGVPAERIALLRDAFRKMLDDSSFKEALAQGDVRFEPATGDELTEVVRQALGLPPELKSKARIFYERLLAGAQ